MSKHWPHSPGDTIKSAEDNDDKEGLATGDNDYPSNSLFTFRAESFDTFWAKTGGIWTQSSGRIGQMSAGKIYASSTGGRTDVPAVASKTFAATQDHYVFHHEQTGVIRYVSQTIGATAPAPNAGEVLNAVLTTDASNITKVVQFGWTDTGLPIFNKLVKIPGASPMVRSISTGTSITPSTTNANGLAINALAADATINAPSGNPGDMHGILMRIKDNGTARGLTWNGIYRAIGVTIPTATTANKWMYIGIRYNSIDTRWDVYSVSREA